MPFMYFFGFHLTHIVYAYILPIYYLICANVFNLKSYIPYSFDDIEKNQYVGTLLEIWTQDIDSQNLENILFWNCYIKQVKDVTNMLYSYTFSINTNKELEGDGGRILAFLKGGHDCKICITDEFFVFIYMYDDDYSHISFRLWLLFFSFMTFVKRLIVILRCLQ